MLKKIWALLPFILIHSSHAYSYEAFVTLGYQAHAAKMDFSREAPENPKQEENDQGYHISFGLSRQYGRHRLGAGIDLDRILGDSLIGYRAVDYYFQVNDKIRLGASIGAASLDNIMPQNGYYLTSSFHYLNFLPSTDASLEIRHGSGLARDRRPEDPQGTRPDIFIDYVGLAIGLTKRF